MSKLSPLGQSMASLFTPESERLRAGAARAESSRAPAMATVPGMQRIQGQKTGDSLSNPNSQGYEPWGHKKEPGNAGDEKAAKGPAGTVVEPPHQGPELIRLAVGWERILVAQKKLCEKAKGLFTLLDGPEKYRALKKSKILSAKSRGCIVDLDVQKIADEKAALEKEAKEKETA